MAGPAWQRGVAGGGGACRVAGRGAGRTLHPKAASLAAPDTPFVTSVVAEGLGLLVSWGPDPAGEQGTSYTVTVAPASGGFTPPPGCAGPFTLSVDGSNSAGLMGGLCTGVAYQATASATNSGGASPQAPLLNPR